MGGDIKILMIAIGLKYIGTTTLWKLQIYGMNGWFVVNFQNDSQWKHHQDYWSRQSGIGLVHTWEAGFPSPQKKEDMQQKNRLLAAQTSQPIIKHSLVQTIIQANPFFHSHSLRTTFWLSSRSNCSPDVFFFSCPLDQKLLLFLWITSFFFTRWMEQLHHICASVG